MIRLYAKQLIILDDHHAAHIVRSAFELYASGAYSLDLLCKKLNAEYNVDWVKTYLDKLFNNLFYYGQMRIKKKLYPHRYPPIVSKDLFDQVQATKAGFNKKRFKYAGLPYIYRGLLRCAYCDLAITPEKHKGHVYYHYTQYNGKHGAKWLREETITEALGEVFKRLQMPEDIAKQISSTLSEVHQHKIEFQKKHRNELNKEQQSLTAMLDNLYMDKLRGKISDDRYDQFHDKLRTQLDDINSKLARLQDAEDNYYITAKYILELSKRAYDLFMSSELKEKRQVTQARTIELANRWGKRCI